VPLVAGAAPPTPPSSGKAPFPALEVAPADAGTHSLTRGYPTSVPEHALSDAARKPANSGEYAANLARAHDRPRGRNTVILGLPASVNTANWFRFGANLRQQINRETIFFESRNK